MTDERMDMRRHRAEVILQMIQATGGLATEAAALMAELGMPDLIVGMTVGERAGRIAECMARANTARRVQDGDGYRRALRRAAVYILGALAEIGEEPRSTASPVVSFEDSDETPD